MEIRNNISKISNTYFFVKMSMLLVEYNNLAARHFMSNSRWFTESLIISSKNVISKNSLQFNSFFFFFLYLSRLISETSRDAICLRMMQVTWSGTTVLIIFTLLQFVQSELSEGLLVPGKCAWTLCFVFYS